jgi:hypothetical protein
LNWRGRWNFAFDDYLWDFFCGGYLVLWLFIRAVGLRFVFIDRRRGREKLGLRRDEMGLGRDIFFDDVLFFVEVIFLEGSRTLFFFTRAFPSAPVSDDFAALAFFAVAFALTGFLVDIFLPDDFRARGGFETDASSGEAICSRS